MHLLAILVIPAVLLLASAACSVFKWVRGNLTGITDVSWQAMHPVLSKLQEALDSLQALK